MGNAEMVADIIKKGMKGHNPKDYKAGLNVLRGIMAQVPLYASDVVDSLEIFFEKYSKESISERYM